MPDQKKGSFGSALVTTTILSLLFSPLPLIGPFLAGWIGRSRIKGNGPVIGPALFPAIIWAAFLYFAMNHEWVIGRNKITAPTGLSMLAWATAISLMAGALAGSKTNGARVLSIVGLFSSVGLMVKPVKGLLDLYKELKPESTASAVNADVANACPERLKKLYNALMNYAQSYDDTLPPSNRWVTAITDPAQSFVAKDQESWLNCPSAKKYGYSMNSELSGKRLKDIPARNVTVLLFETAKESPDQNGPFSDQLRPGRHAGKGSVLYMDGTVKSQ